MRDVTKLQNETLPAINRFIEALNITKATVTPQADKDFIDEIIARAETAKAQVELEIAA